MVNIKKILPSIFESISDEKKDEKYEKIVPAIMKKGLKNVNLDMFDDKTRGELVNATGRQYFKRGFYEEAIDAFKRTKNKAMLIQVGQYFAKTDMYNKALDSYEAASAYSEAERLGLKALEEGKIIDAIRAFKFT